MNKQRYDDFLWFEELEAAVHGSIKEQASWTKPAPRREIQKTSILGQLVKLLFR